MQAAYVVAKEDNVATALGELVPGIVILRGARNDTVSVVERIPFGHKFALCEIPDKSPIIKYCYPIAVATQIIHTGEYIHIHNAKSYLDIRSNNYKSDVKRVKERESGHET